MKPARGYEEAQEKGQKVQEIVDTRYQLVQQQMKSWDSPRPQHLFEALLHAHRINGAV
jgi:hypothetical protein